MTKEEYVQAKIKSGHIIHKSGEEWWEKTAPGYCKTAAIYEPLDPKNAKPSFMESIKGFSYRVKDEKKASGFWKPFVLSGKEIAEWTVEGLKSGNRRRRIRKGLKHNTVKKVDDISVYRESVSRILKSTAIRNGHGNPPEYYDLENTKWWETIIRVSNYTEFWCAFQEDKLAAYICLHVIDDRAIVDGVKSDTDMLPGCPMDAIITNIILDLQERGGINELWYGGKSSRETLDKFKESFGFQIQEVPYRTRVFGGILPYPKILNKWIKRGYE